MSPSPLPVVVVPACNHLLGHHPFHIAGRKYTDAVRLAGALPLLVPNATPAEFETLLALADGVLLTGSPSNVHPQHFDEGVHDPALPLDTERDAWTLPFIRAALAHGLPLLAICRGLQELNVALGGTLHQAVHEVPGRLDHRADDAAPVEQQYGPAHEVTLEPGGRLAALLPRARFTVNSVHGQGIARLAAGLRVEARAPDGQIEACAVSDAATFALGVQWHPEWRASSDPESLALLRGFGDACRARRAAR